jgi:hypothetical protein
MAYYIRVLGENDCRISSSQIQEWLSEEGFSTVSVIVEEGIDADWQQVLIKHKRGKELFSIEKNLVTPQSLGAQEILEFISEIEHAKPESAAKWLIEYLPNVNVIYAFQLLFYYDRKEDWNILHFLRGRIWNVVQGILQADGEGLSNREGHHILWQFSDHVKGAWNMAILDASGFWRSFQMDLSNLEQRKDFMEGRIPKDAKLI